ncbi:MAG: DUF4389 domain-containing protein [Dehalococcoidia bacterium]
MAFASEQPRPPHPVAFDVAYPDRLSRGLIFVKWLLAIPQFIIVYLLYIVAEILAVLAWFAILITGRYPKSFFEFSSGVLRWQANVLAYVFLLRDEYPPFSWEPGDYPLLLEIPYSDRQSRFRLLIRLFAVIPNQIVLQFVTLAALFTTFIAWWAILFTGRYPRGPFKFAVGTMRWYERLYAYLFLLRDEYPPYSINAAARPGNEVLSAVIGLPLFAAYIALLVFSAIHPNGHDIGTTIHIQKEPLIQNSQVFNGQHVVGTHNHLHIQLIHYVPEAQDRKIPLTADTRLLAFGAFVWRDGGSTSFYEPASLLVRACNGRHYAPVDDLGFTPASFARGERQLVYTYFQMPRSDRICELDYEGLDARIRFVFD